MKQFIIDENVANGVLNYLATRPYMEVAGLIQALSKLQPVPEPKPKQKEEK